jgi:aspartate/methionine/tyrosine aminotransferase
MFSKTIIALSAAIVLSTAISASAATKPHVTNANQSATYNTIDGYAKDGSAVEIPNPDYR